MADDMITMRREEFTALEGRARKLAMEKSYLQLLVRLMSKVSADPDLEATMAGIVHQIVDVIGGANIILYTVIQGEILMRDVFGRKETLAGWEGIDDEAVRRVFQTRKVEELSHDFADTKLMTPEFTKAFTWIYPLLVGEELVGVIKMESLHLDMSQFYENLPVFFNYTALILKNVVSGYGRLKIAYDRMLAANEELRRQELFTNSVLENMPDGVVACDAKGMLSLFNRTARDWHGMDAMALPPEEWAGHYDLYDGDGITPLNVETVPLARAFREEMVRDQAMTIVAKGQPPRYILANASPIFDEHGNKIGAVVVMADITRRRQTEEELRAAKANLEMRVVERTEELLAANEQLQAELVERGRIEKALRLTQFAVDRAADAIMWIREDSSYAYVNDAACHLLGYSREEFAGLRTSDVNPAHQGAEEWRAHWETLKQQLVLNFEANLRRKDGLSVTVEISANYLEFGGDSFNCAFVRDITQRKQAEWRLALMDFALQSVHEAAFLTDENAGFLYVNEEACRVLGYTQNELLGLGVPDIDPDFPKERWPLHWHELKARRALFFEGRHRTKDGHLFPVEISANYIEYDGQGYNLALIRDISEREKDRAALRDSNERFRAFMESGTFYAYVKDANLRHLFANKKTLELIDGPRPDEIKTSDFFANELAQQIEAADRRILEGVLGFEELEYQTPLAGKMAWLRDFKFPITLTDGTRLVGGVAVDVTEMKRVEERLQQETVVNAVMAELTKNILVAETIEEMARETLRKAQQVTASRAGYVGYIDQATGFLVCPAMANDDGEGCGVDGKSVVFDKFSGLWGWVLDNKQPLLTNEPETETRSGGTPSGHIPIKRFLSVPAIHGDVLVGQIALANAERPYREEDLALMERMATIFALGMRRKRAENELRQLNEELELRVRTRTAELERMNDELERLNKLFVGRELRMVELKEKIRALEKELAERGP